jgi:anti-sigma factor RsiW
MSAESPTSPPILEEDLHAFIDNGLGDARRRDVQDYLDRHPEAASQVAAFAAQRQVLRSAFAGTADEPVPLRLNLQHMVAKRHSPPEWHWGMAAVVMMALGLGGFGGWSVRGSFPEAHGGIAALAREAKSSYAVYAADTLRPVEMGPERQTDLVRWVSARLQRSVAIPNLSDSGYRFIGGRLVSTEHGPAGMFIYDDANGTRLAMVVRPMAIERDTPMMRQSEGNIAGFTWAARGLGYSVVGTERADALHPLADEVRRQIAAIL